MILKIRRDDNNGHGWHYIDNLRNVEVCTVYEDFSETAVNVYKRGNAVSNSIIPSGRYTRLTFHTRSNEQTVFNAYYIQTECYLLNDNGKVIERLN